MPYNKVDIFFTWSVIAIWMLVFVWIHTQYIILVMLIPSTIKKHNAMITSTILTQITFLVFHKTYKKFLHVISLLLLVLTHCIRPFVTHSHNTVDLETQNNIKVTM